MKSWSGTKPASYTVHVLKVPEGFENVGEEFTAPAKPGQLVIVLS